MARAWGSRSEKVEFGGVTYYRYPDSERPSDRDYFNFQGTYLHRAVWAAKHGPIPDGCHIHHLDGDPLNNDVANLVCILGSDHHRVHAAVPPPFLRTQEHLDHLARIRPEAAVWHGSQEGIEWHREHGRRVAANREARSAICEQCGGEYESVQPGKFCSSRCRQRAYAADPSKQEERHCACGQSFRCWRVSKRLRCYDCRPALPPRGRAGV